MFFLSSKDLSWKVRLASTSIIKNAVKYVYSNRSTESKDKMTSVISLTDTITSITSLVNDKEVNVRKSVIEKMPEVYKEVPSTKMEVLELLDKASTDHSPIIRKMIPKTLSEISENLEQKDVEVYMLPIIKKLLLDTDSEIKMETISNLKSFYTKLDTTDIYNALTPIIIDLDSSNWRTRTAVLKSISYLAEQIEKNYFNEHLKHSFFKMFVDPIWAVRKESVKMLSFISKIFGDEWILDVALPSLEYLKNGKSYACRISYVCAISGMLTEKQSEEVEKKILSLLVDMAQDPVDQVRYMVCKETNSSYLKNKQKIWALLKNDENPEIQRLLKKFSI